MPRLIHLDHETPEIEHTPFEYKGLTFKPIDWHTYKERTDISKVIGYISYECPSFILYDDIRTHENTHWTDLSEFKFREIGYSGVHSINCNYPDLIAACFCGGHSEVLFRTEEERMIAMMMYPDLFVDGV